MLISAGGTGGHIYPAISVGQALRQEYPDANILFMGSSHGPEVRLIPDAGFTYASVPSAPLSRRCTLKDINSLALLFASVFRARRLLNEFRPDVVLGVGGYTSAAAGLAQWTRRGKFVIHEQNAIPGRTNLWLGKFADAVCVSFDGSEAYFDKARVVHTGMPVREEFHRLPSKADARNALGLAQDRFTILVVGGSQGAAKLNRLMFEAWTGIGDCATQVLHQVGERNLQSALEAAPKCGDGSYKVVDYLDMPTAVAAADLAVCRAGASTIAELSAAGTPMILVPYPYAYANHQRANAQRVVMMGAGVEFDEDIDNSQTLASVVQGLRANPQELMRMSALSAQLGSLDAAQTVVDVLRDVVERKSS